MSQSLMHLSLEESGMIPKTERVVGRRGKPRKGESVFQNVPMVISSSDPAILDECAMCGEQCDGAWSHTSRAARYNDRGNYCIKCNHSAGVSCHKFYRLNGFLFPKTENAP